MIPEDLQKGKLREHPNRNIPDDWAKTNVELNHQTGNILGYLEREPWRKSSKYYSGVFGERGWECRSNIVCSWGLEVVVQFSSVQDGIYALGKAHMRSTSSLRSFPNVVFKTVPTFVSWTMTLSRAFKDCLALPLSRLEENQTTLLREY